MTEPTLGRRIMDAADAYAAAISEQVVAISRGTWEVAHADAVTDAMDERRALSARADAAERLAVAVDTAAGDREVNDWSYDARRLDEYNNALAAWRALGEVDG